MWGGNSPLFKRIIMAKFKIIVPKPATANKDGTEVKLYVADEIVDAKEEWQDEVMKTFVDNGWAIEVKVDSPDETVDVEANVKPKRARNNKGQLVGDDPSTPDVNEAWEGGKAPKKTTKKTTKKSTAKKSTKKKSS
jgi:hypothetical protein